MKKIRLGLDIDGVIYRWDDTARYLLKTHHGVDVGPPQTWDWIKDHVSKEQWAWLWTDGVTKHGLFRYGSIFKGSREFLERMQRYCDNIVITSRPPAAALDTMDWLSYQKLPTAEVHIIGAGQKKSGIQPQCDAYIDDASHNAIDLCNNTNSLIIVPDRPYNQDLPDDLSFERTRSWEDVEECLWVLHEQINAES